MDSGFNENRDGTETGVLESPLGMLGASIVLTLGILLLVAFQTFRSYQVYVTAIPENRELEVAREALASAAEVTDLARNAARTPSPETASDYQNVALRIESALENLERLARGSSLADDADALTAANDTLVAIESRAVDLALGGRTEDAVALLYGSEYVTGIGSYDRAQGSVFAGIDRKVAADMKRLERRALINIGAIGIATPVMAILWFGTLSRVSRAMKKQAVLAAELRRLTLHDDLTGLLNRRGFMSLAEQQYRVARRSRRPLMIVFCDMDGLKPINDRFGHEVGDDALKDAAAILRQTFRDSDVIARLGGDEFVILVLEADGRTREATLARLAETESAHNARGHRAYEVSLSVGTAVLEPDSTATLDELLTQADNEMYATKRSARKSVREDAPGAPATG